MAARKPRRVELADTSSPEESAPNAKAAPKGKPSRGDDAGLGKVHELALKRFRRADEAQREFRQHAYEDLEFLEPGGQWTREALLARGDRPCLEFDRLGTTIAQVTGDIRQMRPAIKTVPVDDRGDPETAEVIAGIVRYVENRSDAASVYFAAADQQVPAGIGAWKVITEYASDTTFEQELRVVGIPDAIGIRWDPDAVQPTREDGNFVHVPVDMSREVFEEKYPDHAADEMDMSVVTRLGLTEWVTADTIRVSEYFCKTPVMKTLALMPDGEIVDLTDDTAEDHQEKIDAIELAKSMGAKVRVEKRPGHRIERYLMTASAIIEGPDLIPGPLIPVVPVLGVEQTIGKKRTLRGMVRKAKDSQRAYNYSRSTQVEVVALQPKAPFSGTKEMFKGYERIWQTANTVNHPFLPYNRDPAAPNMRPERMQPPVASAGLAELTREADEDIKAVTGIYAASLGAPSNETSGKAIKARQQEGDVGSFVYIANFARAVRHTARIIVGLIPHIYDTARTLRIVGEDGKIDLVQINQPQGIATDGVAQKIQNDVTLGAYDVAFEMGPSYTTKREAAADGIIAFIQAAPQSAPLVLDLLAKAQDWPMADKIAKRIRSMLPPQIQAEEAQESGEPPPATPPTPPPTPEQQAAMAAEQRKQELAEAQHQLDGQKLQVEQQKIHAEMLKIQGEIQRAAMDHQAHIASTVGAEDPRIDAIANGLQDLAHVVSMIMETVGGEGAPPENGPPDPQAGPPGPIDMLPGAMPGPTNEAPQGAFSFDPSASAQTGAANPTL